MSKFIETDLAREFVNVDEVKKIEVGCGGEGTTLHLRDGTTVHTDESDGMALGLSSTYIPAGPGWSVQFSGTIGHEGCDVSDEPHPVIGWALPSGMPIIAKFGVVFVGGSEKSGTIIRPDGKRLRWDNKASRWAWEVSK